MDISKIKKFNKRTFISIAMLVSGLGLPLSGIMNHVYQYEPLTQSRHFWMSIHNMSGLLFTIFCVLHIILNWRSMLNHLNKVRGYFITKEAIFAIGLVMLLVFLVTLHVFIVE